MSKSLPRYPRTWQSKKLGKKFRVMPWFEVMGKALTPQDLPLPEIHVPWKFGMLVQIGYLLENEHGIWIGVGFKAKASFRDLGVIPKPPSQKKRLPKAREPKTGAP